MAEAAIQEEDVTEDEEKAEQYNKIVSENSVDSKDNHRTTAENLFRNNYMKDVEEKAEENRHSAMSAKDRNITTKVENLRISPNNADVPMAQDSPIEDQSDNNFIYVDPTDNHNMEAVDNKSNTNREEVNIEENADNCDETEENLNERQVNQEVQVVESAQAGHEEEISADENVENHGDEVENLDESQDGDRVENLNEEEINTGENAENHGEVVENLDESQDGDRVENFNEEEINTGENAENHGDVVENLDEIEDGDDVNDEESAQAGKDEEQNDNNTTDSTLENKTEKDNWTPDDITALLIKAINLQASRKDLRTVINCGADVNRPMRNGLCPLHYAAYSDYAECVEMLLNAGANVNATDDIGYTPLHLAARRGNAKSLEILLENGAIINYSDPGVEIHQTDEKNRLGYTTMEPLNLAVQNGHPVCAKILLEKGARPDNRYFMGFEICLAPLDDPECLELLLQYGADPNVFNRCGLSPLMKACKDHHIEAVRKLIKYGADVNAICPPLFEQKSVLQFAINSGNIVIINILLGKRVTLARQGEYKYSAFHSAIIKGRAETCRLLLQHGADPNERTDEGATPMMLACSTPELKERREIVQLLLDCGADVNAHSPCFSYFDPYLAPITEYFKCVGSTEGFSIVRLLIRNGAKLNFSASGLDLEQKRLRDPFSIVPYVKCLENNETMFDFVVSAASRYSPLIIHATDNIPEQMKDSLLYTATRPRELKHLVRVSLRDTLTPGLPTKVKQLPLPPILKSYLLFRLDI